MHEQEMIMLAAHEPRDDPRVDWAAQLAGRFFRVTVVGLHTRTALPSVDDSDPNVTIVRRPVSPRPSAAFLTKLVLHLCYYFRNALLLRTRNDILGAVLLIVGGLVAVVAEVTARAVALVARVLVELLPVVSLRLVGGALRRRYLRVAEYGFVRRLLMMKWTWMHVLASAETFTAYLNEHGAAARVVYCHDLDSLLAGVLYRALNGNVRLIYDSHEYWPWSNVEALSLQVRTFTWFERVLIRRVDHVLTVSDPLARELERVYGLSEVVVVPNAEFWHEAPPAQRSEGEIARIAGDRVSFLFQGSFAPERGLEELIAAWQDVDPARAVLFLRGPENRYREALVAQAEAMGLRDKAVYFIDAVDVEDLVRGASEADVGVIPYKADLPAYRFACPNKLSQYLHAGVAILSNDIAYVRSVIEAGECGAIYDVTDRASIVRAVHSLSDPDARLDELKANAARYGRDVFNWQVQSRDLEQIVAALAGDERDAA